MGELKAICMSTQRGTPKTEVLQADIEKEWGIAGDAHGGKWHRQISLLALEKIEEFRNKGAQIDYGAFGENLVVEGFDLRSLPVGTRFRIGEAVLELTQIGKECHSHCEIFKKMGDCIMPREGVFTKVIQGGHIQKGDAVAIIMPKPERPFTAAVITLSDQGAAGTREDKSGPLMREMLIRAGYDVVETLLLADEEESLKHQLIRLADQRQVSVILTTGGTGFSSRDITPEATAAVCDRMADGIAEAVRAYSMTITKRAMFSRAKAGIRKGTLIINLPGSPKAVQEALEFLLPELGHGLGILRGTERECARMPEVFHDTDLQEKEITND